MSRLRPSLVLALALAAFAIGGPLVTGSPAIPAVAPAAAQVLPPLARVDEATLADGALVRAPRIETGEGSLVVVARDGSQRAFALDAAPAERTTKRVWLGTDQQGRDLLARSAHAARLSLLVALLALVTVLAVGGAAGIAAALAPVWLGAPLRLLSDALLALPRLLLLLALAAAWGGSAAGIGVAIGLGSWMVVARLVEERARAVLASPLALAARAVGASPLRLAVRHVAPQVAARIVPLVPVIVAEAILVEASLGFLGVGAGTDSWGRIVAEGRHYLAVAPWIAIVPGVLLVLAALASARTLHES